MPDAISPLYTTLDADLGRWPILFRLNGNLQTPDAGFRMYGLPRPRLRCHFDSPSFLDPHAFRTKIVSIPPLFTTFPAFVSSWKPSRHGFTIDLGFLREPIDVNFVERPKLRRVVFHIVNFLDFCGSKHNLFVQTDSHSHLLHHVILHAGGWRIIIQSLPDTTERVRLLQISGGYAITHVGQIERVRGGRFRASRARDIIEFLRLFLSFARGAFCCCALTVGYEGNDRLWGQWGSHMVYPWRAYLGWFDKNHATQLEEVFPGFYALLKSPMWRGAAREVLYLYLRANNTSEGAGVDGGIILAQAALEKLSWVYLVQDTKAVSQNQFDNKWRAKERIRELLRQIGIPQTIPRKLKVLRRQARQNNWADGVDALVDVRNDLVHSRARYAKPSFAEAWMLAQWYIELTLLRLAGHVGEYISRISAEWHGQVSKVPWAP